ncbi:hypothetical protein GT347_09120 [Xylophilus rhododendri]|uniref:Uncharacterized protein n=1 Tax=Xylophilus rhododendri TaxID=2697032 RepID=A0A857J5L9_9BURK|nr:hypothetical protein [Xylophilus rhododendri]QHI98135.1 hypothetical protein GT347_09120 [Xylophilus rhododendri]
MRPYAVLLVAAFACCGVAHAASKTPRKPPANSADAAPSALPGTIHFGPDPKTGKWRRLTDKEVAPRSAGVQALEHDARRDATGKH